MESISLRGKYNTIPPFRFNSLAFFVGILSSQTIYFAGTLKLGELLAIAYLFLLVKDKESAFSRVPYSITIAAIGWTLAQIISDILNKSALSDTFKGVGVPILFLITIVAMVSFFARSSARLPSFLLGLPFGAFFNLFINPPPYFLSNNPWKWGYGSILASLALVVYSFILEPNDRSRQSIRKADLLYLSILCVLSGVSLANESRAALIQLVILILYWSIRSGKLDKFISALNSLNKKSVFMPFVGVVLAMIISNFAVSFIYQTPFILSLMPTIAQEKTLQQSDNKFGLLLGGRSELFASAQAFLDKPFMGHGSWAQDPGGIYTALRFDRQQDAGQSFSDEYIEYNIKTFDRLLIPAHSFLFGALVWAGILGGLFWVVVLSYVIRSLLENYQILSSYFFFRGYSLIWSIFFSPFGYSHRFGTAVFIAALISTIYFARKPPSPSI